MLPHKKVQQPNQTKKIMVSFVIRDEHEPRHRAGVNSLQFDRNLNRLFSAGRDGIIRAWDLNNVKENPYVMSLEHHTDWVNDIVLCCGGKNIISASSDTTVKVWNAYKGFCMSTLKTHKDYVRALAYAKEQERVASAGLDRSIYLWDINTLTALTSTNNTITTSSLSGSKNSIYSLAMNPMGTIIVSGSTEKVLRVWDPRTCQKLMKLIGHKDNVKTLIVNRDGTQCLSGSSDGTVKLWSLGQQQCIITIRIHKEGVWALAANDSFSHVVSGGRDRRIYKTDLKDSTNSLVGEEKNPVLKLCPNKEFSGLWVATDDSNINYWPLTNCQNGMDAMDHDDGMKMNTEGKITIRGAPAIRKYHVLNDKRHILTEDSDGNVALHDVLQAKKVKDLGRTDFNKEIADRARTVYIPNWFTVDLKTGFLTINLAQEENDCFSAWVSGKDIGFNNPSDQKYNYGTIMLNSLLEHWRYAVSDEDKEEKESSSASIAATGALYPSSSSFFQVPPHTPVIFTEIGNRTMYRVTVQETGGQSEIMQLNESIPDWIREVLLDRKTPEFVKISFCLLPLNEYINKNTKRERLIANDFIQVQKIVEHVCEKICGNSLDGGHSSGGAGGSRQQNSNTVDRSFGHAGYDSHSSLMDSIDILCNDKVLDPNMELRTVKHHIWKSSTDLILYFRTNKSTNSFVQRLN